MSSARIGYVNILSDDIERQAAFYSELLGFPELVGHRSPIYRCLDGNGVEMGFNAPKAYELLGIVDRRPAQRPAPVTSFFTIEVEAEALVDHAAARAGARGGRVLKQPYVTYYNGWQCVLEDPEGNVFRVNHRRGARTPFDELPDAARVPIES